MTLPSRITMDIVRSAVMSCSGSRSTTIRSAAFPAVTVPTRSSMPIALAAPLAADHPAYALANEVTHTDKPRQRRVISKDTEWQGT